MVNPSRILTRDPWLTLLADILEQNQGFAAMSARLREFPDEM